MYNRAISHLICITPLKYLLFSRVRRPSSFMAAFEECENTFIFWCKMIALFKTLLYHPRLEVGKTCRGDPYIKRFGNVLRNPPWLLIVKYDLYLQGFLPFVSTFNIFIKSDRILSIFSYVPNYGHLWSLYLNFFLKFWYNQFFWKCFKWLVKFCQIIMKNQMNECVKLESIMTYYVQRLTEFRSL